MPSFCAQLCYCCCCYHCMGKHSPATLKVMPSFFAVVVADGACATAAVAAVDSSIVCAFFHVFFLILSALVCALCFFPRKRASSTRLWMGDVRSFSYFVLCVLLLLTLAVCRRQCDGMRIQLDSHHKTTVASIFQLPWNAMHIRSLNCFCSLPLWVFLSIAAAKSTRPIHTHTRVHDQACEKNSFHSLSLS